MPLLIIEPSFTSKEAHDWIIDVFIQILEHIELNEETADNLTYLVEHLTHADADLIFEKAIKGLLK